MRQALLDAADTPVKEMNINARPHGDRQISKTGQIMKSARKKKKLA